MAAFTKKKKTFSYPVVYLSLISEYRFVFLRHKTGENNMVYYSSSVQTDLGPPHYDKLMCQVKIDNNLPKIGSFVYHFVPLLGIL